MTIRRSRHSLSQLRKKRRRRKQASSDRDLRLETLEERALLAGLQLIGIQPNDGARLTAGEIRDVAPRDLTFNFNAAADLAANSLANGIRITRSGGDGTFGDGNEVIVTPGFVGIGEFPSQAIVRFKESLPDDSYRVEVFAFDDVVNNISAVRDIAGDALVPANLNTDRDALDFELDLGAQVIAVVPQPISRVGGTLTQADNKVIVYFNDDDLDPVSAENPAFYQLVFTNETVANTDDIIFNPTSIVYDAASDTAELTFAANIYALPGLPLGAKTFRLRIGTDEVAPSPPKRIDLQGPSAPDVDFGIDLIFPDASLTPSQQDIVRAAANRWEEIIIGDLPDEGLIDDIAITVNAVSFGNDGVGGIIGRGFPTNLRNDSFLPFQGQILLDEADVLDREIHQNGPGTPGFIAGYDVPTLYDTVLKELGHVLGFGRLFPEMGLIQDIGTADPRFLGSQAATEYSRIFETAELTVPLQAFNNESWDESIFEARLPNELMTTTLSRTEPNLISVVTVAALADMGYVVDRNAADLFAEPGDAGFPGVLATPYVAPVNPVLTDDAGSSFDQADAQQILGANFDTGAVINVSGDGSVISNGQSFTLTDVNGAPLNFEFSDTILGNPLVNPLAIAINFTPADTADTIATEITNKINGAGGFTVLATRDGSRITLENDQLDQSQTLSVVFSTGSAGIEASLATSSVVVSSSIDPKPYPFDFPGQFGEPGNRDINVEEGVRGRDNDFRDEITTVYYNFKTHYGFDPFGNPLSNVITARQKERAREVFQFYNKFLGVQFVETASEGITIATGDLRAVRPTVTTGPGAPLGIAGGGIAIMDAAETWNDQLGGDWFIEAMQQIGRVLGLGNAFELPPITVQAFDGNSSNLNINDPNLAPPEPVFPGDHDIVNGRQLYRPQQQDIDLYRFELQDNGEFTAETFAERLANSSLLDTTLAIYQEMRDADGNVVLQDNGQPVRELVARNDDYFSEDSFIRLQLGPGVYYVGVSASGNDAYDPTVADSGLDGVTEGDYDLRLNFRPDADNSIIDADNNGVDPTLTAFDGDKNGVPGGVYNFWFRAAPPLNTMQPPQDATIYVDKANQPPVGNPAPNGQIDNPFNSISNALQFIADQRDPLVTAGADPEAQFVVRLVGNGGEDGDLTTLGDNLPYQLGFAPPFGTQLEDGGLLNIPRDVTMMIDEGAIFKSRLSSINVGSESPFIDRSGGALQVLGTPNNSVIFTSFNDESIGIDTNPSVLQTPANGDWGGLLFRTDQDVAESRTDFEAQGIFLNYVNHADIRFGGGKVVINSVQQTVTPVHLIEARPTISHNLIVQSQDAAISADPDSFKESNFYDPGSQFAVPFTADYDRVGPDIDANTLSIVDGSGQLLSNSINGLFIRIVTDAGNEVRPQTVSGRWDDIDIVHVLTEDLVIQGAPGGPLLEKVAPSVNLITFGSPAGGAVGSLVPGDGYRYRFTFVDANGKQSPPSAVAPFDSSGPIDAIVDANGVIQMDAVPVAPAGFVGRRIYRSQVGGVSPYLLIAQLDAVDTSYVDNGTEIGARDAGGIPIGGILDETVNEVTGVRRAREDASLVVDPGTIVKLEGARIQTGIGAQLIAEGRDGREIVFTARADDRYGASGSFDTNNDASSSTPAPGDWAGIVIGQLGSASIDHALITFGGGIGKIGGNSVGINAIEIHQADARITNSIIENNADGQGAVGGDRFGLGFNTPSAVFIRGSQPIFVNNIVRNNDSVALSINANALHSEFNVDLGRSTGRADRFTALNRNRGPLIKGNSLFQNGLNGLEVRGGILTTQSIWDDTDIVHVLRDTIYIPDTRTFGGLRLESSPSESLVVKLSGADAGFTATGKPLDIDDRIGGILHVIGQPGFPVVLTSLRDDSVGAGFEPNGRPNTDTNSDGNATSPSPGDWRSVQLLQYAHDRNVGVVLELEDPEAASPGTNAVPDTAQLIGFLAPNEKSGDETRRLGFEINGVLAEPNDLDVYSFKARPGTEVWIDIDRTDTALDTVIELITSSGQVIARSDDSYQETLGAATIFENNPPNVDVIDANVLQKSLFQQRDFYGTNPRDAGFRIVLPGPAGAAEGTYHVRVRSSNPNLATDLLGGLTSGSYQMQIRLRELDEFAGSTVQFADIRYATTGIDLNGQILHSPLLGEAVEILNNDATDDVNNSFATAQPLGNLLSTDQATISVAGVLGVPARPGFAGNSGFDDLDFYRFEVNYENTQSIFSGQNPFDLPFNNPNRHVSVTFDIDYGDGFARANTNLFVFDSTGTLVLTSTDSNINEDNPRPLAGSNVDDLARGSNGPLDPFVGTVNLEEGSYFAVVTSNARTAAVMDQFFQENPTEPLIRLEPVNSVNRIAEDRIDSFVEGTHIIDNPDDVGPAHDRVLPTPTSFVESVNRVFLPGESNVANEQVPLLIDQNSIVPFNLGDINLFILEDFGGLNSNRLNIVDPFTGKLENVVGVTNQDFGDFALNPNSGRLFGFTTEAEEPTFPPFNDPNIGRFFDIDAGTAALQFLNDDGIDTFSGTAAACTRTSPNFPGEGFHFEATAFGDVGGGTGLFAVGSRGREVDSNFAAGAAPGVPSSKNILYQFNPTTGIANNVIRGGNSCTSPGANTNRVERGQLVTSLELGVPSVAAGETFDLTVPTTPPQTVSYTATAFDTPLSVVQNLATQWNSFTPSTPGAAGVNSYIAEARPVSKSGSGSIYGSVDNFDVLELRYVGQGDASALRVQSSGSGQMLSNGGFGPGGQVTGLSVVDNGKTMYAVTDEGGLFRVNAPSANFGASATFIANIFTDDPTPQRVKFEGLTAGPRNVEGGRYQNLLFGIDNGTGGGTDRLFAFDPDSLIPGQLEPVFFNGQTSLDTHTTNAVGVEFSNLDFNLFHKTIARGGDPGHGVEEAFDGSRRGTAGTSSLYFGFESAIANNISARTPGSIAPTNNRNFDFAGGAAGTIETATFDLSGYAAADLPTLYFNYYLETEDAAYEGPFGVPNRFFTDSFRVFATDDDGNWTLLATNNQVDSGLLDEFDPSISPANVQELFDNNISGALANPGNLHNGAPIRSPLTNNSRTGSSWRQARIDLGPFAGKSNVRLRFDFNTAGDTNVGDPLTTGDELRAIAGAKLRDEQSFTTLNFDGDGNATGTTRYELNFGQTIVAPSGSGIADGDTFTITNEGVPVTYEFDNDRLNGTLDNFGDGVAAGNIRVPFFFEQSAEEVAVAIQNAVETNFVPRVFTGSDPLTTPLSSTVFFETDANVPTNDSLATSINTGLLYGSGTYTASTFIGDNPTLTPNIEFPRFDSSQDVDIYRFRVNAGSEINITTDTSAFGATGSDTQLTLFDSNGNIVRVSNTAGDETLSFRASGTASNSAKTRAPLANPGFITPAGVYYVAVSGAGNGSFDPFIEKTGANGDEGFYDLTINVSNPDAPLLTNAAPYIHGDDRLAIDFPYTYIDTHRDGNRINIPYAQDITSTDLNPNPYPFSRFIEGRPDVTPGSVSIPLHSGMSNAQVADAIAFTLADDYTGGDRRLVKTTDEIVRVIGRSLITNDLGRFGLHRLGLSGSFDGSTIPGDGVNGRGFGNFEASTTSSGGTSRSNPGALRGLFNDFEGVYIDDIVIGFAERGELVTGLNAGDASFVDNLNFDQDETRPEDVLDGPYQLEIRRSTDFARSIFPQPTIVPSPGGGGTNDGGFSGNIRLAIYDGFDTNARQSEQVSLAAPAGWEIADQQTFTLSDGLNSLTFEYDDLDLGPRINGVTNGDGVVQGNVKIGFRNFETSDLIAERIRNAINSSQVQSVLAIAASLSDGTVAGVLSTSNVVNLFGNAVGSVTDNTTATPYNPFNFGDIVTVIDGIDQTPKRIRGVDEINTVLHSTQGDDNHERAQGQILIHSNSVSNSLQFGISATPGVRDGAANANNPHAGPVRNTQELNTARLTVGSVITNNLLFGNVGGGIEFAGDANTGTVQLASVPFGRIVNNTIYGVAGTDIGIKVADNAGPTIINNIVSNTSLGIEIDATSQPNTVLIATLFKDNTTAPTNIGLSEFDIDLDNPALTNRTLFVDPTNDNFNLAAGSLAIDSAVDSQGDRSDLIRVRNPLGIAQSPILAPTRDITGQLRVDDPFVATPDGQGQNAFKDRGAVDRADIVGPNPLLIFPRDNDQEGKDIDSTPTIVQRLDGVFNQFLIQINDGPGVFNPLDGVGVDNLTVTPESVTIEENGRRLALGVDYSFEYDTTNGTIRLTPLAGIWLPGGVYVITLNNTDKFVVTAIAGDQTNDGDTLTITSNNGDASTFELESGYSLFVPQTLEIQVPAAGGGVGGVADQDRFSVTDGVKSLTFEFDQNNILSNPNNIRILLNQGAVPDTADEIAQSIVAALLQASTDGLIQPLTPKTLPGGAVHVGASASHSVNTLLGALTDRGAAVAVNDGGVFTIDDANQLVTFEFDNDTFLADPLNIPIVFDTADATNDIAEKILAALEAQGLGVRPPAQPGSLLTLNNLGNGHLNLRGTVNHVLDTTSTRLTQAGTPGVTRQWGLQIPLAGASSSGGVVEGDRFTISDGATPVTFEFDSDGQLANTNNFVIPFADGDSADLLAAAVQTALAGANIVGINPQTADRSAVFLGGTLDFTVDLSNSLLTEIGQPGVPGNIPVDFIPDSTFTADDVAVALFNAVESLIAIGFPGVTVGVRNEQLTLGGVASVQGVFASQFVESIKDLAGNDLQPNQSLGETRFTILLGGVALDLGDAPDASILPQFRFPTQFAENGARHVLRADAPLFLGSSVDADINGQPSIGAIGDDFDHVTDLAGSDLSFVGVAPFAVQAPNGAGIIEGDVFSVKFGAAAPVVFEFSADAAIIPGNVRIPYTAGDSAVVVADNIVAVLAAENLTLNSTALGGGLLNIGGRTNQLLDLSNTSLTQFGAAPFAVRVPAAGGGLGGVIDGETFTLSDGADTTIVFEFDNNATLTDAGNVAISFTSASTAEDIAAEMVVQLTANGLSTPLDLGGGDVNIGGEPGHALDISSSNLTHSGNLPVAVQSRAAGLSLSVPANLSIQIPVAGGGAGGITDGESFTITNGPTTVTFEFDSNLSTQPSATSIFFTAAFTADQIAESLRLEIMNAGLGLAPQNLGNGLVHVGGTASHVITPIGPTNLTFAGVAGPIADGDSFSISLDGGTTETVFEFNNNGVSTLGNVSVNFTVASTADEIATEIANKIGTIGLNAANLGNASVQLTGDQNVVLNTSLAPNVGQLGVARGIDDGETFTIRHSDLDQTFVFEFDRDGQVAVGNLAVPFMNGDSPDDIAVAIIAAIDSSNLDMSTRNRGSGLINLNDDEDGVSFGGLLNSFIQTPITVVASGAGLLDAWIDWNRDGDWNDPGEKIFDSVPLQGGVNAPLMTQAPLSAVPGFTYARFRFSSLGGLQPDGLASDGEVEDYQVNILAGSPPRAVDDPGVSPPPVGFFSSEDTFLNFNPMANILANDTDADGDNFFVDGFDAVSTLGAAIAVKPDGTFSYDPRNSAVLQALDDGGLVVDTFTYTATDVLFSGAAISRGTVSISVTGVNDAPIANDDPAAIGDISISEDDLFNSQTMSLFANDVEIDAGDSISLASFDAFSTLGAAVVVNTDGTFTYDPRSANGLQSLSTGDVANDSFTYTITDGSATSTATVTIEVTGVNDPVIAVNDPTNTGDFGFNTTEDIALNFNPLVNLLTNDIDPDSPLTAQAETMTSLFGATVEILADGTFRYDPTAAPALQQLDILDLVSDTFSYTVLDGIGSDTAVVSIAVSGVNDAPVAVDDPTTPGDSNYATDENTAIPVRMNVRLTANDFDFDNDPFVLDSFDAVSVFGAAVVVNTNGTFTYDPTVSSALNALGAGDVVQDTFTYRINDGSAIGEGTVTITVTGQNDVPVAVNDGNFVTDEDTVLPVNALVNLFDNDIEPDANDTLILNSVNGISFSGLPIVVTTTQGAALTVNPDGTFRYDPRNAPALQGLTGGSPALQDTFTYTIADTVSSSNTATVTITVSGVNDAPRTTNDVVFTAGPVAVVINVLANDQDVDGTINASTLQILQQPGSGSVVINNDQTITYVADPGPARIDAFTYRVADNEGVFSAPTTVTVNVSTLDHMWQNPVDNLDVNASGDVTLTDVLLVINFLRDDPSGALIPPAPLRAPWVDVNGDDVVSTADILPIIVNLRNQASPEGEGLNPLSSVGAATVQAGGSQSSSNASLTAPSSSENGQDSFLKNEQLADAKVSQVPRYGSSSAQRQPAILELDYVVGEIAEDVASTFNDESILDDLFGSNDDFLS